MNWKVFRRTCLKFVRLHPNGFALIGWLLLGIIGGIIGSCVVGEVGAVVGFCMGLFVPFLIVLIIFGIKIAFCAIKETVTEFKDMYLAGLDKSDK